MSTVNLHVVVQTAHHDLEALFSKALNDVEAAGHKIISAVLTDDDGQVHLSSGATAAIDTLEKDAEPILKSTLDGL
jgi:hypothetical protein